MADLIDRQVAIDALRDAENHAFNSYYQGLIKAHKIIADLPSVNPPEPKTGHWYINEWGNITCSECGCGAPYDKVYPGESVFGKAIRVKSTFCPTCGAKMEVEHDR